MTFATRNGKKINSYLRIEGMLGKGTFSVVRKGVLQYKNGFKSFAIKCIDRKETSNFDEAIIRKEASILKRLKHKNVIKLYAFCNDSDTYYLVMERLYGGDLFERIMINTRYSEIEARTVCKNILEAVQFIHQHSIAHRDLKPENLLLTSRNDNTSIKISDFGFATEVQRPNSLRTLCGTRNYIAPEILTKTPYDERADLWSVGVILYILLAGYQPFSDTGDEDLFYQICTGEYTFYDKCWETISREAKDLICYLMEVDFNIRWNATQALNHSWFFKKTDSSHYKTNDLIAKSLCLQSLALNLPQIAEYKNRKSVLKNNRVTPRAA